MSKKLEGKIAIVTGASNGIGRAIAERLAQDGATVVVNYGKSADKGKAVVAGIVSRGGNGVAVQGDMSQGAGVRRLVQGTGAEIGRVGILVENTGEFIYQTPVGTNQGRVERMFCP